MADRIFSSAATISPKSTNFGYHHSYRDTFLHTTDLYAMPWTIPKAKTPLLRVSRKNNSRLQANPESSGGKSSDPKT